MKRNNLMLVLFCIVTFSTIVGITSTKANAPEGLGTLMGNSSGTKYCCAAGGNDCSASPC